MITQQREMGMVMRMRMAEARVSRIAHRPGLSHSGSQNTPAYFVLLDA